MADTGTTTAPAASKVNTLPPTLATISAPPTLAEYAAKSSETAANTKNSDSAANAKSSDSTANAELSIENQHTLWSFSNAFLFMRILVLILVVLVVSMTSLSKLKYVTSEWANYRCNPLVMPFAGLFGHNAKENFDFCMNKIFTNFSMPFLGSIGNIFQQFASMLQSIFSSLNGLRNSVATMGGGINIIFQEFIDRISNFFFQLRVGAIALRTLFGRLYAILFSVMYMGLSGITGVSSFTNTFLFSFLDTFCFPGHTELIVQDQSDKGFHRVPIKDIKIGDVLLPGKSVVTATFQFYSRGQEMVQLGPVTVSTNHYVLHEGKYIMAGDHPHAIHLGPWNSDDLLYCVNTSDHHIPVSYLTFMDYDETSEGDKETLNFIDSRVNGFTKPKNKDYTYKDSCFAIDEHRIIKTTSGLKQAKDIAVGDTLSTGSEVVGLIRREVTEVCTLPNGIELTPATLYWNPSANQWNRSGEDYAWATLPTKKEWVSFVVVPHSQIELEDGTIVRDYMELCSPDAEQYYSQHLTK